MLSRPNSSLGWSLTLICLALCFAFSAVAVSADSSAPLIKVDVTDRSVTLRGKKAASWSEGPIRVFSVTGDCRLTQGELEIQAKHIVMWFHEKEAKTSDVAIYEVYAEGKVALIQSVSGKDDVKRYSRLFLFLKNRSTQGFIVDGESNISLSEPKVSAVYKRGSQIRALGKRLYTSKEEIKDRPEKQVEPEKSGVINIYSNGPIESWVEGGVRKVVITGGVVIEQGDTKMTADNVVLWLKETEIEKKDAEGELEEEESDGKKDRVEVLSEAYAEGDITLYKGDDIITADRMFLDHDEDRSLMINATVKTYNQSRDVPIVFGGKEIRQVGKDQYIAKDGYATTCAFGHPHYRFQGKKVRLIKTESSTTVTGIHNTMRIGDVPVTYWPLLTKDVDDDSFIIKSARFGNSSEFGTFLLTDWDLYDLGVYENDWSDATLELDFYGDRGPAIGADFEYAKPSFFGFVDTYYLQDSADEDAPGLPVESSDRGRFLWRHRQWDLPYLDGWRLDAEVSYLSDRGFLEEFFEEEFKEGKDQETILYLRKLEDNRAYTYLQEHRINRFETTTERLPELGFSWIGEPIWGNRLVFTSYNQLANLNKRIDEDLGVRDPDRTVRFDTDNEISMPLRWGILKLDPFVGARLTAVDEGREGRFPRKDELTRVRPDFEERKRRNEIAARRRREILIRGQQDSSGQFRFAGALGVNASTQFHRVYNVYSKFFDVNRLRHIMTPEIRYEMTPYVSEGPESFNQFDAVDAVDDMHRVFLGFRNRLQTKRGAPGREKTVDWMIFDLEYTAFPGSAGLNEEADDFVELDYRWQVTNRLSFVSEGNELNIGRGQLDVLNVGLEYALKDFRFFGGHRFVQGSNSTTTIDVGYKISEKWGMSFLEQFDFNSGKTLANSVVLSRSLHQWVLDMRFEVDEGEDDTIFMFSLSPIGLREGALRF